MAKLFVDLASYLLNLPPRGPNVASSCRRSQTMPTLRAMCAEAIRAPDRRILTTHAISQLAAGAYRSAGLAPLYCTAQELADGLDIYEAGSDDPMMIHFVTAGVLLRSTKAAGSTNDQCILMLELAAPRGLMETLRIAHQCGAIALPPLSEVPAWAKDLLLGRRNNSGIVRAIPRKSAV